MIEVTGNLWDYPADVRVITTNGTVKKNGECVMGRGCALEAKKYWSRLPTALGALIKEHGNHTQYLGMWPWGPEEDQMLYSFPVKHNWYEKADISLIERSALELVSLIDKHTGPDFPDYKPVVVIPRPGCGNGGLKWEDVKPVLEPILDDRFHVITFK